MSSLSISISEQPTEFHRFRYETEVSGGKLGGLLYGRHGNKSCVRLRITGIDPLMHKALIVVGGTVNPELYPHPFFMVGDDCSSGAFQFKKDVSSLGDRREIEICLQNVSLVRVVLNAEKLAEAIGRRKEINFNPYSKSIDEAGYKKSNLLKVRLAFQLWYETTLGQLVAPDLMVVSDVVADAKFAPKLGMYNIHPAEAPVSDLCTLWIYFDKKLRHSDASMYQVIVADSLAPSVRQELGVHLIKQHLMIVTKPDLSAQFGVIGNERVKCELTVRDTASGASESRSFILCRPPAIDIDDFLREFPDTV